MASTRRPLPSGGSGDSVDALPTGPKQAKSNVLSRQDEAVVVAFRRRTLLPLDDCLYALQATIPHLIRSSLHRCLQRNGISQRPNVDGDKPAKKAFKACPIGFFHIDIAEVQTAEGKLYLFVGIDRTSQFAYVQLVEQATRVTASPLSRPFPTDPHRPDRQRHPVPLRSSIRVGAQTF